jgi:hypothetical protein
LRAHAEEKLSGLEEPFALMARVSVRQPPGAVTRETLGTA